MIYDLQFILKGLIFFLEYRQNDGEFSTFAQLALAFDVAFVQVDDFLHVSQSETEAFYVVYVAGMNTIEFIEDFLHVLALNALSVVGNGEAELVTVVPGSYVDVDGLIGLAVFHSVVHEVGNGVLEVYLINVDS